MILVMKKMKNIFWNRIQIIIFILLLILTKTKEPSNLSKKSTLFGIRSNNKNLINFKKKNNKTINRLLILILTKLQISSTSRNRKKKLDLQVRIMCQIRMGIYNWLNSRRNSATKNRSTKTWIKSQSTENNQAKK